jgi:hypothetical protein
MVKKYLPFLAVLPLAPNGSSLITAKDLTIDVTEYSLDPLDRLRCKRNYRILGIFKWMVDG